MANQHTNRGRSQARARVAASQDHEISYEAQKTGASKSEVRDAIKSAGNNRARVEAELDKK